MSAFYCCDSMDKVIVPATVRKLTNSITLWDGMWDEYDYHKDFYFCGDAPSISDEDWGLWSSAGLVDSSGDGKKYYVYIRTDVYYLKNAKGWDDLVERFSGHDKVQFYPYDWSEDPPAISPATAKSPWRTCSVWRVGRPTPRP